jgi:hypothetical protein
MRKDAGEGSLLVVPVWPPDGDGGLSTAMGRTSFSTGSTRAASSPASSIDDIFHSEFIMYTHINPAYTMIPAYHFTAEARYKGAEVVLVAPDVSPSHTHADYYVPIKPGTDAALGLAMAQVIIEEGIYNEFVRADRPALLVRVDNRPHRQPTWRRAPRQPVLHLRRARGVARRRWRRWRWQLKPALGRVRAVRTGP